MYRRTMLGAMQDPTAIVLAIVLTALEEAILRSTMIERDTLFREFLGMRDLSDAELSYQRDKWSVATQIQSYREKHL